MKKLFTILILLFAILGGSGSSFAQNKQQMLSNPKNTVALPNLNGQQHGLLFYLTPTTLKIPGKDIKQTKTKSLIQLFDSIYQWKWDTITTGWNVSPYSKTIDIVYDASHNQISYISQIYNGSVWITSYRCTYTYDASNNKTSEFYEDWTGSAWENSEISTYSYDVSNNDTGSIRKYWDGSIWVNEYHYSATYDANNNEINSIGQDWGSGSWVNSRKDIYTYDINNNMTSLLSQNWDGSAWVNNYQYISIMYDVYNNFLSELCQEWIGGVWVDNWRGTYTHDINNNYTGGIEQSWDGSAWVNSRKYTDTYDANNNLTVSLGQNWVGGAWVNYFQYSHSYDANNLVISDAYKSWNSAGTKVTYGDSIFYYFNTVVGINDVSAERNSISIYPNPASGLLTLCIDNIKNESFTLNIYNISGQPVRSEMLEQDQQQINIGDLSNGIYIVEIKTDQWTEKQKLIIQR